MSADRRRARRVHPPDRRRWLRHAAALGLGALPPRAALAADSGDFPAHPVTLWVPWPAGAATDIALRLLAELASPGLGQVLTIRNRAGAGGTLAMPVLQQARPDGYTIAQMPYPVFRVPHLQKVLWDPIRDVTPILQLSSVSFGILVATDSPLRSLDELFAYARAHPGELSIATNGVATTPHVVLEKLFTARGLRYIHVPYKGTVEQLNAIASGQVMAGVSSTGFGPAVDAGTLRLLALCSAQRSRRWPQVPVLRELGFDIVANSPYGLAGPRGLPPDRLSVLHDAFKEALSAPRFHALLAEYDQQVDYLGPHAYAQSCREIFAQERAAMQQFGLGAQH
ncbi:tripartite tricarboxylate transporter substrate binding protein [Verminephrobacter aporrectodeae subsp. tuberculatae]|uniref:Tripartite tricarboxylate transporter substrate binding protein n=1 Tax=Verminephrobacter aporrectodeae subsp. tuberculatae TaxID=1110392 RepID=A0ABT3KWZ8_9BURK|nr:tripartite tricarboxylate transporter substrate binding protein [Verminephrobacter aporrectodeae subsp. tuberculatae]